MKKSFCFVMILILSIILLAGCESNRPPEIQTEDIAVGVIETRGDKEKSRILFYDNDMNELGSLPLDYATVGNVFYCPLIVDDALYVIPQGYANKKDAETVLEIDLSNLNITKHSIEQLAMNCVAVSDDYVYTCNTLNGVSYINKCNKENGNTESIDISLTYISKLIYVHDRLYAFGTTNTEEDEMVSDLFVYDTELNLLEKIDISKCGANQYKVIEYNGELLFTSLSDRNDNSTNMVGMVNVSDYSVETIQLNKDNPLDLAIHDGKLYVTHFDVVQLTGGGLSIYDLTTGELKDYSFEHGAEQMAIANDKLYILADWKIYVYDVESMELLRSVDVEQMDDDFSYLSGIFVIDN